MAKAKTYKKTRTALYVIITLLLIIALCMGWALFVLTNPSINPMTGDGPKTVDHNTNDYYSIPPKGSFTAGSTSSTEPPQVDYSFSASDINKNGDNIVRVNQKDPNIINILLVGLDQSLTDNPRSRSDSMIILSYNKSKNEAKLVSIMRDSYFPVKNNGWGKLNSAMVYGGIGRTINLINRMLGMDIQQYIIIDFDGLAKVVDIVGGIYCKITPDEAKYHRDNSYKPEFKYDTPLTAGDHVLLDGKKAINHARTRYLSGGDWERTRRQRDVLYGMLEKVKQAPLDQWISIANEISKYIRTNADINMIYNLGKSALIDSSKQFSIEGSALPFTGTWQYATINGMAVIDLDMDANKRMLTELIYG